MNHKNVFELIPASAKIMTEFNYESMIHDMERITRVCYGSERNKMKTLVGAERWVSKRLKQGHETVAEFGEQILVKFTIPRALSHRFVRSRLMSVMQKSLTHYNTVNKQPIAVLDIRKLNAKNEKADAIEAVYMSCMMQALAAYNKMRHLGADHQLASLVLPVATMTTLYLKGNIRLWRTFFKARCALSAGDLTRLVSLPLLREFKTKMPALFYDFTDAEVDHD